MTASQVKVIIQSLQTEGRLPKQLNEKTVGQMAKSFNRYFSTVSKGKIQQFTDAARQIAQTDLEVLELDGVQQGGSAATERGLLTEFLEEHGAENIAEKMNMDFFLRIPREIANGAAVHLSQNFDQLRIDNFPALELSRVYGRDIPRGSELDKAGPDNGWDVRWEAACEESGDEDALNVFNETGRMVALKSSGVWQSLGDGAGGYDDTLGNAFAPFAFNSGMDTDEVSYRDCVEIGLLDEGDAVTPAAIDYGDLLNVPEDGGMAQARLAASLRWRLGQGADFTHDSPTDAQKRAGNYAKRKVSFAGMVISVEVEKGGERTGLDASGEKWSVKMPAAYGYIRQTEGADGDHVDCYLNEPLDKDCPVFVVNQLDANTKAFDEHKIFFGWNTNVEVQAVYRRAFSDGGAFDRLGDIQQMTLDDFKLWVKGDAILKQIKEAA